MDGLANEFSVDSDTGVTFSDESTTWTSLLTINLDTVMTIDLSATATSTELSDNTEVSINSSSDTSGTTVTTGNGISLPNGFDETGEVVVVATRGPDSAGEESDSDGVDGGSGGSVDTPEVVGGVVGGIAGLAIILLVALFALRWYRNHRQSPQALPGSESENPAPDSRSTRPLAEGTLAGSAAGFLKRLSGVNKTSQGATATPPMAQRSFERVSGRKLPSAFSPALAVNTSSAAAGSGSPASAGAGDAGAATYSRTRDVSRPIVNPGIIAAGAGAGGAVGAVAATNDRNDHDDDDEDAATNLSDTSSCYRDSRTNPFVSAGGMSSPSTAVGMGQMSGLDETETIRPSPARTPVIHAASGSPFQQHPHPDSLSPPVTPVGQQSAGVGFSGTGASGVGNSGLAQSNRTGQSSPRPTRPGGGTLGRSLPSFDGSRSSRFTEDV